MVIVLNGASSTGKTRLINFITKLSAETDTVFIRMGIDALWTLFPAQYRENNEKAHLGFQLIQSSNGGFETKTGVLGKKLIIAFMKSMKICLDQGFNILADDVILNNEDLQKYCILNPEEVFLIGVHCDKQEALLREKTRGDRLIGLVEGQWDVVHQFEFLYDFSVNNSLNNNEAYEKNAIDILNFVKHNKPKAFFNVLERMNFNSSSCDVC